MKASTFMVSTKSLDCLPDPQQFTNSTKVLKRSPPSLSCLRFLVFLHILSLCLKIADLKPLTSDTTTHAAADACRMFQMLQNACRKFRNAPESMQKVSECYRMHSECSRMHAESSRMHSESSRMHAGLT